jgi:hypothetical protein
MISRKGRKRAPRVPPFGGEHGAQGVVAGGLWVRCGGTVGRSFLAWAGAYVARVMASAKIFSLGFVLIGLPTFQ